MGFLTTKFLTTARGAYKSVLTPFISPGKHPFVIAGDSSDDSEEVDDILDFGNVSVGNTVTRTFPIRNVSDVDAKVFITQEKKGTIILDEAFTCKKKEFYIPANTCIEVTVCILYIAYCTMYKRVCAQRSNRVNVYV